LVRKPFACLDGLLACLLCPAQEESDPSSYSCDADSAARLSGGVMVAVNFLKFARFS